MGRQLISGEIARRRRRKRRRRRYINIINLLLLNGVISAEMYFR